VGFKFFGFSPPRAGLFISRGRRNPATPLVSPGKSRRWRSLRLLMSTLPTDLPARRFSRQGGKGGVKKCHQQPGGTPRLHNSLPALPFVFIFTGVPGTGEKKKTELEIRAAA